MLQHGTRQINQHLLINHHPYGSQRANGMQPMKNVSDQRRRKRGRPNREQAPSPGAILEASLRAFARNGFEGSSLRSIAADAGVDVALASRQFGSKLDLWKATVDALSERMVEMHDEIAELQRGGTPIKRRLRMAFARFTAFSCTAPELGKFIVDETMNPGERCDYVQHKIWKPHRAAMLPLIAEGVSAGVVRGTDPEMLLHMLNGAVALPLLMTIPSQDGETMAVRLSEHIETLFMTD